MILFIIIWYYCDILDIFMIFFTIGTLCLRIRKRRIAMSYNVYRSLTYSVPNSAKRNLGGNTKLHFLTAKGGSRTAPTPKTELHTFERNLV